MVEARPLKDDVVLLLLLVGSCRARDAAVGAVSRDGRSTGFVASRFAFEGGESFEPVDDVLSAPPVRADEAAAGAASELRLAFFVSCGGLDGASLEDDIFDWLAGVFAAVFVGALVITGADFSGSVTGFFGSSAAASTS